MDGKHNREFMVAMSKFAPLLLRCAYLFFYLSACYKRTDQWSEMSHDLKKEQRTGDMKGGL